MAIKEISSTQYLVNLHDLGTGDDERVGAKAVNEAELLNAGFEVPEALVLTTDAFNCFLQANQIGLDQAPDIILSAAIPEAIVQALRTVMERLDNKPLAVRSSAIAEDLPGASFAGQYETILDVRGQEALEAAVLGCWASWFSPHAAAYRNRHELFANGMAVLIQQMVVADVAGVAFTANPVSGDRAEVVINAVHGLGERLVSGEATPDEWIVKGTEARYQHVPESALDVQQVRVITDMARRVEAHFGAPQDIEWALADNRLYVLQSRPITTLRDEVPELIPVPIEVPSGFWQHDASRFPKPACPMFWLAAEAAMPAAKSWAEEFGLLMDGIEITIIGGWPYQRMKPLGGQEPPPIPLPKPLMALLVRIVPMMRARLQQAKEAVRTDKAGRLIKRWHAEWRAELEGQIAVFRDMELEQLSDMALVQHFDEVIAFMTYSLEIHTLLNHSVNFMLYELVSTCKDLLGWDEAQAFELVNGTSYKSTEPARQLGELAKMAQQRPVVRELLEHIDEKTADRLVKADPEFAEAFHRYQQSYGCRSIRWEIIEPSLAERPALSLTLIRDQMERAYDPADIEAELKYKRSQKAAEARAALAGDSLALARFGRVLQRAEMAYPIREDNQFYTLSSPFALVRYAVLEIGKRLANRGTLSKHDDVFFLYKDEATSALLKGEDCRSLAQRRQGEKAWAEANPGPPFYGEPPAPPAFDFLPAESRLIMESLIWSFGQMMEYERSKQVQLLGQSLEGIAASAGQYTGPVRVINDESEFQKIQPGDIMVCPMTSPVWSVLFANVGALVTDAGGLLSHPAIIAREYHIPAVVATGNATALLQDGEMVTVDGTAGVIERLA